MAIRRFPVLLALLSSVAFGACLAQSFSPAHQNAAIEAYLHRQEVQNTFRTCSAHFGDKGAVFRFMESFWQGDDLPIALAVDKVWPSVAEAKKRAADVSQAKLARNFASSFAKADARAKFQTCNAAIDDMQSGKLRFASTSEADAKLLMTVFDGDDRLRIVKRNTDFTVGCMKRSWNTGGRDFAKARATCECVTKAITASASDPELDEWVRDLSGNRENELAKLAGKPWFVNARQAMVACQQ